jgi:ribosomal protein L20
MSIKDRRKREKNQRRNEIIDAAEKLFVARGYDDVTIDEIANEAEVNKALLYYYFKSKEALFFAGDVRGIQILHEIYVKYSKLDISGRDKVRSMGNGFFEFSKKYPDYFKIYSYVGSGRFELDNNEDAKEVLDLMGKTWRLNIEAIMQGMEYGTMINDLDRVEISIYLLIMSMGVLNISSGFKEILSTRKRIQRNFGKICFFLWILHLINPNNFGINLKTLKNILQK